MNTANRSETARMMTLQQACGYCGMGRTAFRPWARQIGAEKAFGSHLIRYDRVIIDRALDTMPTAGEQQQDE